MTRGLYRKDFCPDAPAHRHFCKHRRGACHTNTVPLGKNQQRSSRLGQLRNRQHREQVLATAANGGTMRLQADAQGHYSGDFRINGRQVQGLIDTGARPTSH